MGRNLKWIFLVEAALAVAAAGTAYMWSRPVMVRVAPMEKDVPIEVFGLGTVVQSVTVSNNGALLEEIRIEANGEDTIHA